MERSEFWVGLKSTSHRGPFDAGVVFQSASLDRKLTVLENLRCQAALYGLAGSVLSKRIDEVTEQLRLRDRLKEIVDTLSGGLKRRVEIAKGILHRPKLLCWMNRALGLIQQRDWTFGKR